MVDAGLLGSLATLALANSPTLTRLGVDTAVFRNFQLPGATVADSRSPGESEGTPVFPRLDLDVVEMRGGYQRASAFPKAEGTGRTEGGAFLLDLGPIEIHASGLVSESVTSQSIARSTTSIGELAITGFSIPFLARGLEWTVSQEIDKPATAGFAIGSIEFGGRRFASPDIAQVVALFDQLNTAMAVTGFAIEPPKPIVSGSGGRITPIRIGIRDSVAAAQVAGPVYEAVLADVVNQLEGAIVAGLPETGLGITVANVAIAAAVGRGGVGIELGGADARLIRTPVETYEYDPLEFDEGAQEFDASSLDLGSTTGTSFDETALDGSSAFVGSAPEDPTVLAAAPQDQPSDAGEEPSGASEVALPASYGTVVANEKFPALVLIVAGIGAAMAFGVSDRRRIRDLLGVS